MLSSGFTAQLMVVAAPSLTVRIIAVRGKWNKEKNSKETKEKRVQKEMRGKRERCVIKEKQEVCNVRLDILAKKPMTVLASPTCR